MDKFYICGFKPVDCRKELDIFKMAKNLAKDMTTGSPMKLILGFSLPLLFGFLFQQFYSVVDTVIVGQFLGMNALAGVGATGSINFMAVHIIFCGYDSDCCFFMQKYSDLDEDACGYYRVFLCIYCNYICRNSGRLSLQYAVRNYPVYGRQQNAPSFFDAVLFFKYRTGFIVYSDISDGSRRGGGGNSRFPVDFGYFMPVLYEEEI